MDRPLWQMVVPLLILGFALQRGALAALAVASELPLAIAVGAALQAGALVALALAIFLGRRRSALAAAIGFALAVAGTLAVAAARGGPTVVPQALTEVVMAALVVAGIAWLTRHEFGSSRE